MRRVPWISSGTELGCQWAKQWCAIERRSNRVKVTHSPLPRADCTAQPHPKAGKISGVTHTVFSRVGVNPSLLGGDCLLLWKSPQVRAGSIAWPVCESHNLSHPQPSPALPWLMHPFSPELDFYCHSNLLQRTIQFKHSMQLQHIKYWLFKKHLGKGFKQSTHLPSNHLYEYENSIYCCTFITTLNMTGTWHSAYPRCKSIC